MKEIPLRICKSSCKGNPPESASTMVDDEDYDMLMEYAKVWRLNTDGYAVATGRGIGMHRVIMGLKHGDPLIDHKDTNRLNNQKYNLHTVTRRFNNLNKKSTYNPLGFMGVVMRLNENSISYDMGHNLSGGIRIREAYSCIYTAAYAYNKYMLKALGDIGFRNDLSNSGFTIEELETKLITDRLRNKGRPKK